MTDCCRDRLAAIYAGQGIDVDVTDEAPTIPPPWPVVAWRCQHGALFFAAPSEAQRAAWDAEPAADLPEVR